MNEDEAVAQAEARTRMPGGGRWLAQRLPDGSWRAVRVLGGPAARRPAAGAPPVAPHPEAPPPVPRREWGLP